MWFHHMVHHNFSIVIKKLYIMINLMIRSAHVYFIIEFAREHMQLFHSYSRLPTTVLWVRNTQITNGIHLSGSSLVISRYDHFFLLSMYISHYGIHTSNIRRHDCICSPIWLRSLEPWYDLLMKSVQRNLCHFGGTRALQQM